ncbi:MAG: flap endonuclease-1 [Thermoplasmata archaeon]
MGVNLTPILQPTVLRLDDLRGRSFAVDGNNVLYQFLALIRRPDGTHLTDREGNVTSHLVGLLYRTTRLISDYAMELAFVFDGRPSERKRAELRSRRKVREKAKEEYEEAVAREDYATAWSKAVTSTLLTRDMIADAQRLLTLLGVPWVQAPSEGEAQAAYLCAQGDVWATSTRDYDALLYGTPRLLRYLTIAGREFLPSRRTSRPLEPELLEAESVLRNLGLTRAQLVDLALLVGTDYNPGVYGIGPKTALQLLREHGRIEDLPEDIRVQLPSDFDVLRDLFLQPPVEETYEIRQGPVDPEGVLAFLCEEKDFARERVTQVLDRLTRRTRQPSLETFET